MINYAFSLQKNFEYSIPQFSSLTKFPWSAAVASKLFWSYTQRKGKKLTCYINNTQIPTYATYVHGKRDDYEKFER